MNTRHAQLILTILREGSFTAAAKALFITQPTLSQTVKQIETQLGEPIFLRGHVPVELTPAGQLYVHAARRMLKIEAQMSEALSALHGQILGTLHLGLPARRADELLPHVLPEFTAAYPDVRIEAICCEAPEAERMLISGELDMAFVSSERNDPRIEYLLVASDEIMLMAGMASRIAQRIPSGSTISLSEAVGERFVLPSLSLSTRRIVDELFAHAGITPKVILCIDDLNCAKRVCACCGYLMLAPAITLLCDNSAMQKLCHYRLTDAFLPPLRMAHAKDQSLAPYAQTLSTLMSNRFRALTAYRA